MTRPGSTSATQASRRSMAPILGHGDAMRLQSDELQRTIDLLASLDPAAWASPTDCPAWDVRRMQLHVLGACQAGASMRENAHQMRRALVHRRRHGGPLEAALSSVQVAEREHLTPVQLLDELRSVAPRAVAGRARVPALVRRVALGVDGPVKERWTFGYLLGTIYLRDLWMHRVDTARATGQELVLTPDHDGALVADVVADWHRRLGRPVRLRLSGPAGGSFGAEGSDPIELDAVEFCRIMAGRATAPDGPLQTIVPF